MRPDRAAVTLALAFVGLSLGVEALGWVGGLRPLPLGFWVAAVAYAAYRSLRRVMPVGSAPAPAIPPVPEWIPMALIGTALLTAALRAFLPPTGDDELMYHLPLVRLSLAAGRWAAAPDLLWAGYPRGADHLFLAGYALAGETGARLGAVAWFGLSVLGVGAVAGRLGGRAAGLWLAAAWACADVVLGWSPVCYVDVALAAVAASALAAALSARDGEAPAWPAVLLAGAAASVKYSGVLVPLALLPVLGGRRGAAAIAAAAVFLLPTAARNVANGLDPLAPFGPSTDPYLRAHELAATYDVNERWAPLAPLTLAWDLATSGRTERYQAQGRATPPLLLYFLAAAALGGRAGGAAWAAWTLSTWLLPQSVRFHLWAMALLAAASARPVAAAPRAFALAAGLLSIEPLWRSLRSALAALGLLAGLTTREGYLEARLGDHLRSMRAIAAMPGRTLLVGDPRTYYAGAIHPCDYTSATGVVLYTEPDADSIARRLSAAGVRQVYVNGDAVAALELPTPIFRSGRLEPAARFGRHAIFRLVAPSTEGETAPPPPAP